jgi:hypothetical protein
MGSEFCGSRCPVCGFKFRIFQVKTDGSTFVCPQCFGPLHLALRYKRSLHVIMVAVTLACAYWLSWGLWSFLVLGLIFTLLLGSPISILSLWLVPPRLERGEERPQTIRLNLI